MRQVLLMVSVIAMAAFAGCMQSGQSFDSTRVDAIETGVTTEAELIEMFDEPNQRTRGAGGARTLTWTYMEVSPGVRHLLFGGTNARNQTLHVTLDADGVVEDYQASEGATEMRQLR